MRIAYLTQHYPPDNSANASRVQDMSRHLASLGDQVTVVAPPPSFPWGLHPRPRGRRVRERDGAVDVVRLWTWQPRRNPPGFVSRMAYYLVFTLHATAWLMWNARRFDVVIGSAPPLFAAVPGWAVRAVRGRRLRYVLEVRDLWIDAAVALGFVRERSLSTRASRWLERRCLHRADLVTTATGHIASTLEARGVPRSRLAVVPNGADLGLFGHVELPEATGPRFIFAGNIGQAQALDTVVRAVADLRRDHPRIELLLAGDGDARPDLERLVGDLGLSGQVRFLGVVPRGEVAPLVATARAAIAFVRPKDELRYLVPVKAYEALAVGVPFLASTGDEVARLASDSGGGRTAGDTVAEVAAALRWFLDHPDEARAMGLRGRRHAHANYDRQAIARRLHDHLAAGENP